MAKYLFLIGMLIALVGVYLFTTHANVMAARSLMACGVILEVSGIVMIIEGFIKKKVI